MKDYRKQIMVAGSTEPLPGYDIHPTFDAQSYFAADYVDAWISMRPEDVDRADYLIIPGKKTPAATMWTRIWTGYSWQSLTAPYSSTSLFWVSAGEFSWSVPISAPA